MLEKDKNMKKYRKKPVVIEAFQLSYEQALGKEPVPLWFISAIENGIVSVHCTDKINNSQYCLINTLEGTLKSNYGDYIIQGVNGELYPCNPDLFEKTYEELK